MQLAFSVLGACFCFGLGGWLFLDGVSSYSEGHYLTGLLLVGLGWVVTLAGSAVEGRAASAKREKAIQEQMQKMNQWQERADALLVAIERNTRPDRQ